MRPWRPTVIDDHWDSLWINAAGEEQIVLVYDFKDAQVAAPEGFGASPSDAAGSCGVGPQPRSPHRAYGAPIQRPILSKRSRSASATSTTPRLLDPGSR